jgi:plastocyanin
VRAATALSASAALGAVCLAFAQTAPAPAAPPAPLVAPGPNKVMFPEAWSKGTMYATVDRPDTKQYREFYTTPDVLEAVRAGKPVPDGALIVLAAYMAQVDAAGVPLKDANGRFMKGNLAAVNVQQKKAGSAEDIPASIRNGDWVYQSFTPDGKVNDKANLTACYQCHLPFAKDEFLTNFAKLKGTFPSQAMAKAGAGPTEVAIAGFAFGPTTLKVNAGDKVTWTNADDTPHQIALTGPDGKRSELMLKGQSATLQFDAAGNIAYTCGLHPTMKGTIEVTAKN